MSGLREALEKALGSLPVVTHDNGYRVQALPKSELLDILAAHPAEPAPVVTDDARAVRNRAVDVIQDNLDGPAYDGGPSRINVAKIVRALSDAGLLGAS